MFLRRRSESHGDASAATRLTIVRDVVEISAIILAGIWAFYTFVYENQIKPAQSQPDVQVESTLTRLGERNGLVAIDSRVTIRNVGLTGVWLYGFAETVTGTNVALRRKGGAAPAPVGAADLLEQTDWTVTTPAPVYVLAFLTKLADARSKSSLNLLPGETIPFDRVFYVAAGRFDEVQTHVALRFSNRETPISFHYRTSHGIVHIQATSASESDLDGIDENESALSLWR